MNARKGLRRHDIRHYIVDGAVPHVIERAGRVRFYVHPLSMLKVSSYRDGFFSQKFTRLYKARAYAEEMAG